MMKCLHMKGFILTLCGRVSRQAWKSNIEIKRATYSSCCYPESQAGRRCNAPSWKKRDSIPDLQRFLSEIGTDPKEARFWLKQFQNVNQKKPFALVEIDPEVFADCSQLDRLASAVSFLQRNSLRPVLVFGDTSSSHICDDTSCPHTDGDRSSSLSCGDTFSSHHTIGDSSSTHTCDQALELKAKAASVEKSCALSDSLSEQDLESCILFAGSGILMLEQNSSGAQVKKVKEGLIQWCIMRRVIPIIPSFGETPSGQIIRLKMWEVTSAIAKQLQPHKVIKVNCHGGFQNESGQIIANINLPFDFQAAKDKSWCTGPVMQTIREVSCLLSCLHEHSSVVITAADKVLQELFTHHGSGTFLKMTELILKYHSLDTVDVERLKTLLSRSFSKMLSETYFNDIKNQVHTIFVSECYTAAAVILYVEGCDIPYLCKFAVSAQAQGEGTGEILWDMIRRNFTQLFWRSRPDNQVNHWYFRKSEGSWNDKENWIVFWYGVPEPVNSSHLIQMAVSLPKSFH